MHPQWANKTREQGRVIKKGEIHIHVRLKLEKCSERDDSAEVVNP